MALVLAPTNQLILHFVDRNGKHATSSYWLDPSETDPLAGGAVAIANAAQGISLSALVAIEIKRVAIEGSPGSPTTGPYERPADKASYGFRAADGTLVKIEIGAPTAGQFGATAIQIDPTVTAVSDFITTAKTNMKSAEGATIKSFASGFRRRPSGRKGQ